MQYYDNNEIITIATTPWSHHKFIPSRNNDKDYKKLDRGVTEGFFF